MIDTLGGTTPKKVLDIIGWGCTPDLAKKIYDQSRPPGARTRREPIESEWYARTIIEKALEAEIHEMEV